MFASLVCLGQVSAQPYDQTKIEAHLSEIYRNHGERLFKWKRPIYYIVAGRFDQGTKQKVDECFAYIRDLTGLDIQEANPAEQKGNFILVFADPLPQIAHLKSVRAIFGKEGQSDADYQSMLERLERDHSTRQITKRTSDAIVWVAVLTNLTVQDDKLLEANILRIIARGLTQTNPSDEIHPSVWNTGDNVIPMSRLPSIDEVYLRNLYQGKIRSGTLIEQVIPHLAAAMAFDLNS